MLQTILPVVSECVIAFDLSLSRYISIGPGICALAGFTEGRLPAALNFWYPVIHQSDLEQVKKVHSYLLNGHSVTASYRVMVAGTPIFRHITEKRSIYTDALSGHEIILSILNEHGPSESNTEDGLKADALKREQFLLSLINSQTNFLIRLDKNGLFTFVNNRYCKVFGYTEDELIGQHFSINTAPEDLPRCQAAFEQCLKHPGRVIPLIRGKLDKSGTQHPSEWEFVSVINQNGEVSEIQGIGQDISQRLDIENRIKKTTAQLDTFIESITDSFLILDNDWRFIKTNSAFESITGKTHSEVSTSVLWDVFPALLGTEFEKAFRQAAVSKKTAQFILFFDPLKMWFRTTVYPSDEGLTVFIKNITAHKIAEEALNMARTNLEALINNTLDHIWSINTGMNYVYTNTAYKDAIAAEADLIPTVGKPVIIFGTEKVQERWRGYYKRALSGERFDVVYEHLNSVTNDIQYYEVGFNPIYNGAKEIVGVACFARDITQRLQHEKEIINQNERLRHIASISSHELRRPVASMLGLINIIDFENFNNPENKEIISHLLTVGQEIDEVIRLIVDNTFTGKSI